MPCVRSVQAPSRATRSAASWVAPAPLRQMVWPLKDMQSSQRYVSLPKVEYAMKARKATMNATPAMTGNFLLALAIRLREEVAHLAEFFVTLLHGFVGGERRHFIERKGELMFQQTGGFVMVFMGSAGGFGDDAIDELET